MPKVERGYTIDLPIPPEHAEEVLHQYAYSQGWREQIPDGQGGMKANEQTPQQFTTEILARQIINSAVAFGAQQAGQVAQESYATEARERLESILRAKYE